MGPFFSARSFHVFWAGSAFQESVNPSRFSASRLSTDANAGAGFKRQGALHFFSLGFGRAYPMQLLSRLIQSSVEPFCRDKLVIDVMIMTYTMSI